VKVAGRVILTLWVNSNAGQDTFNLCIGEFGNIRDSEEELGDPVQQGEAIVSNRFTLDHDQSPTPTIAIAAISDFPFRHLTFLLLFPFYAVLCHLPLFTRHFSLLILILPISMC